MLQHPFYVSVRPVGDGLIMALGQILTGIPWIGVLIANAAMCCALHWMLASVFGRPWPLIGSGILILRMSVFTLFVNSYWGQALAATGGMIVLGVALRVMGRGWSISNACMTLIGIGLLASSRIYEGVLLCVPLGVAAFIKAFKHLRNPDRRRSLYQFALVTVAGGAIIGAGLAFYNVKTTGSAMKPAYLVWRNSQTIAPTFIFQKLHTGPHTYYNLQDLQFYTNFEVSSFHFAKASLKFYFWALLLRAGDVYRLYLRPLLLPGLLVSFLAIRRPAVKLAYLVLIAGMIGQMLLSFGMPIYEAPYLGAAYLLVMNGLTELVKIGRWHRGASMVATNLIAIAIMFGVQLRASANTNFVYEDPWYHYGYGSRQQNRAEVERKLDDLPGKHLVIVRYEQGHPCIFEWVWNGAEIDQQKIVWARELEPASTATLVRYYKDRQAWLLRVNGNDARLSEYPKSELPEPRAVDSLYPSNALTVDVVAK
jgi:hypothetical protein